MIEYPSIDHLENNNYNTKDIAYIFPKYDGTNFRGELDFQKGFIKFGTRTHLSDLTEQFGTKAIPLIKIVEKSLLENKTLSNFYKKERIVLFFELFTNISFAGSHGYWTDEFYIKIIDIHNKNNGFINPSKFIEIGKDNNCFAQSIYVGKLNQEIIQSIKLGSMGTFEGVVIKFDHLKNEIPNMIKLKNEEWYKKLKDICNGDMKKFEELK